MFLRFIHIVACVRIPFLFKAEQYSIVCIYHLPTGIMWSDKYFFGGGVDHLRFSSSLTFLPQSHTYKKIKLDITNGILITWNLWGFCWGCQLPKLQGRNDCLWMGHLGASGCPAVSGRGSGYQPQMREPSATFLALVVSSTGSCLKRCVFWLEM